MLSRGGAVCAQRRRPARRRPARRGRVDAARCTPTITHMACAERVACVVRAAASTLEHALGARAVRRARAMRCARHGAPRRALPQHLLHVAVLGAAGRRRAERRCVGRCASPWTGRLGSRWSLLDAANSWPSRFRSTSQTIMLVVLERILLSSLRCATGIVCMDAKWREGCLKCV